jgi:hypothetical protein
LVVNSIDAEGRGVRFVDNGYDLSLFWRIESRMSRICFMAKRLKNGHPLPLSIIVVSPVLINGEFSSATLSVSLAILQHCNRQSVLRIARTPSYAAVVPWLLTWLPLFVGRVSVCLVFQQFICSVATDAIVSDGGTTIMLAEPAATVAKAVRTFLALNPPHAPCSVEPGCSVVIAAMKENAQR